MFLNIATSSKSDSLLQEFGPKQQFLFLSYTGFDLSYTVKLVPEERNHRRIQTD